MIYKDTVNIIKDICSRLKGVNFFDYQGDDLNNQQHNYKTFQVYLDDVSLSEYNMTTNIVKISFELYFLGFPEVQDSEHILDVQDTAYNMAINVLALIQNDHKYDGVVRLYDYSIMTLSRYTAQSNAGVKLSVVLEIPNGVDLCKLPDQFNEKPYTPESDHKIDVDTNEIGDIDVLPIDLPSRRPC